MAYYIRVLKYNRNHDPKTGRFTSGPSGGSASPNRISSAVTNLGRAGAYTSTDPMTGNQMETSFHRLDDGRYSMVETNLGEDEGAAYQRGVISHDEFKRKMRAYGGQTVNQSRLFKTDYLGLRGVSGRDYVRFSGKAR